MDDIVQGSPEWFAIRLGKVTASRVADIIAKTRSGFSSSRANYLAELIAERLTSKPAERFQSAAMQHGTEYEAEARRAYELHTGHDVMQVGFVHHPTIRESGASPDGLIGDHGLVEIKCPNTATHIETIKTGAIPAKYYTQMYWQMAATGRQWCDFASYHPRLPGEMSLFVKRVDRDDEEIAHLEQEVKAFLDELRASIADLRKRFPAQDNILAAG